METAVAKKAVQITIEGRVQGVGFRYWARTLGQRCGLAGFVRNRADGSVEVVAEGEEDALRSFIDRCYEGPPTAEVTELTLAWGLEPQGFSVFEIRR